MLNLNEQLTQGYAIKTSTHVCITIGVKRYWRKKYYKYFSNQPIEYIVWGNKRHCVNTVQEGFVFQSN